MDGPGSPGVGVGIARSAGGGLAGLYGLKQLFVGAAAGGLGSGSAVEQPAVVVR